MAKLGRPIIDPTERMVKICAGSLVYDSAGKTWRCKDSRGEFTPVSDTQVCLFFMRFGVLGSVNRFQKKLQKHPALVVKEMS